MRGGGEPAEDAFQALGGAVARPPQARPCKRPIRGRAWGSTVTPASRRTSMADDRSPLTAYVTGILRPSGDRLDDALDQRAHRPLLGLAREVAPGDHCHGQIRPVDRSLDLGTGESDSAVAVCDLHGPVGPTRPARTGPRPAVSGSAVRAVLAGPGLGRTSLHGHVPVGAAARTRWRSNHSPASRATSSSAPGSSNR
jgi:hypothetical protein